MAVYDGTTKERMGSAHGNYKMKKGRISNEETDRVVFKLPFVPVLLPRFSKVLSRSPGPVSTHASKYR